MFFSMGTVSTLLAIWSTWIKIKPNEKTKQHKTGANRMEFQNVYNTASVKSAHAMSTWAFHILIN
jgi:hypothetical protein